MDFEWFKRLFVQTNKQTDKQTNELLPSDIEKDTLQLGFAAGYTGRSIHDINSSLNRIETGMPNKEWLLVQLEELTKKLDEGDQKRLETILNALYSLRSISAEAPEPLKSQIIEQVKVVEQHLGPSKTRLVQLVKSYGQATFKNLAREMGITDSGFRNLVFMTLKQTNEIEKFNLGKTKWLRYRNTNVSNEQTNVQDTENTPRNQEETDFS